MKISERNLDIVISTSKAWFREKPFLIYTVGDIDTGEPVFESDCDLNSKSICLAPKMLRRLKALRIALQKLPHTAFDPDEFPEGYDETDCEQIEEYWSQQPHGHVDCEIREIEEILREAGEL